MEKEELEGKIIRNKSYANVLMMLVKNDNSNRAEENYATALSDRYNLDRGYISNRLADMDGTIIKSSKEGRRKIFMPDWDKIQDLFYRNPDTAIGQEPDPTLDKDLEDMRKREIERYKNYLGLYNTHKSFKELFVGFFKRYADILEENDIKSLSLGQLNRLFTTHWSSTLQGIKEYKELREEIIQKEDEADHRPLNGELSTILEEVESAEIEVTVLELGDLFQRPDVLKCYKDSFYTTFDSLFVSSSELLVLPKESIMKKERKNQ